MPPKSPYVIEIAMEMALPKAVLDKINLTHGPQMAQACGMSTSVGGIGPLLRERIFAQGDLGIEVVGVCLLYETVWAQVWQEWGQIVLQKKFCGGALRSVMTPTDLDFELPLFDGQKVQVKVWELAFGKAKVYFLDCPEITYCVYPGPKDAPRGIENSALWSHWDRLKQSWLIGRGGLALVKKLNRKPDIIVLSETPTFFAHHRVVKDEFQMDQFFSNVRYIFNDHTPLEYAHPLWDAHTLERVKVDSSLYSDQVAWNPGKKLLDVTSFLVGICEGVFGVSKKHCELMRNMPSLKPFASKIKYITNGVCLGEWQTPELKAHEKIPDGELVSIKEKKRNDLVNWAWRRFQMYPHWADIARKNKVVLWTRRITPYKRLDVLLKMLRFAEYRKRFLDLDLILFIGGRLHQQDTHAQDIVFDLLDLLNKDIELGQRIIFVDNFNVWEAPLLYQGADGSIMMSDDFREASATGFMKAQLNGAGIIATPDGAIPEFVQYFDKNGGQKKSAKEENSVWGPNGFEVPYVNHEPTPEGFLEALEQFGEICRDKAQYLKMLRGSLAVSSQVDIERTALEMKSMYEGILNEPVVPR